MADTDKWNQAAKYASMMNMVDIAVYIMCIGLSWWALQKFRFDVLLKRPNPIPTPYIKRYAVSGRNSRTHFSTLGIGTPQLEPSLQYLAI